MSLSVKVKLLENNVDYIAYILLEDGSEWHPIMAFIGTDRHALYTVAFDVIDTISDRNVVYGV